MHRAPLLLLVAAVVLAVAGARLWLHNPVIVQPPNKQPYQCAAPYDTVLNGASDPKGAWAADRAITRRCRNLAWVGFVGGTAFGLIGAGLAITALTWEIRRRRTPSL